MTDTADTENEAPESDPGIAITVNGEAVSARPGELLIDACERNGVYIPRFCYHPRMEPVGMCRMCIVEVDSGRGPALQPSCMLTCMPDMVVNTESPATKKAQDGVLEFLLINHPLDCPVCDKGGECPLQDQTMAFGPGESRFVEEKRHFEKPIPISDTVFLDRERCILCDRCTRFAKEVAGDPLIHFQGRGNHTEVNTFPDEPFSSYFSGNTVQICPVGALTAVPYRFKARPWDLEEVESTSVVDSVGSRITVQSSRNQVLRLLGADADAVNWGWLSDKERFGFEAGNSAHRLVAPLMRGTGLGALDHGGDELVAAPWSVALAAAADALSSANPAGIGVIGGARLTNEAQYVWTKLVKGTLGSDNVDAQLGDGLPAEVMLSLPRATIDQTCTPGGTIILLGPDPKETLGALFLRVRHAVVHDGATLIDLSSVETGLTRYAAHHLPSRPGDYGQLARALVGGSMGDEPGGVAQGAIAAAATAIAAGGPVTIILGRASAAESAGPIIDAAAVMRDAWPEARFLSALTRGNVHGALDMGMAPGLLPGRQGLDGSTAFETVPDSKGLDTEGILKAAAAGKIDTLVLLGADPIADFPDADLARRALDGAKTIIAVDLFITASVAVADIVLAAAGPGEVDGSFTNLEGRVSVLNQKVTPPGTARADWLLAVELAYQMGHDLGIEDPADVWAELNVTAPIYANITPATLAANTREGVLVDGVLGTYEAEPVEPVANDAYGLRLVATRSMYDSGTMLSHCESSAHLLGTTQLRLHPTDFDRLGVAEGDRVSVLSSVGTITTPVVPDEAVRRGVAALRSHQDGARAHDLIAAGEVVTNVRVERT